jgi:hypothetical protein
MKEQLLPYSSILFNFYAPAEHNIYSNYTPLISSSVGAKHALFKNMSLLWSFLCMKINCAINIQLLRSFLFFLLFSFFYSLSSILFLQFSFFNSLTSTYYHFQPVFLTQKRLEFLSNEILIFF